MLACLLILFRRGKDESLPRGKNQFAQLRLLFLVSGFVSARAMIPPSLAPWMPPPIGNTPWKPPLHKAPFMEQHASISSMCSPISPISPLVIASFLASAGISSDGAHKFMWQPFDCLYAAVFFSPSLFLFAC